MNHFVENGKADFLRSENAFIDTTDKKDGLSLFFGQFLFSEVLSKCKTDVRIIGSYRNFTVTDGGILPGMRLRIHNSVAQYAMRPFVHRLRSSSRTGTASSHSKPEVNFD
jgi:hypothetical protein